MKNIYLKISIRIALTFSIAIIMSFISDSFHEQFGDAHCNGRYLKDPVNHIYVGCLNTGADSDWSQHEPTWHWGYRHWLWLWMGISLSVIQLVKIITLIDKSMKLKNPNA